MMNTGTQPLPYGKFAALYDRLMAQVDYQAWGEYLQQLLQQAGAEAGARVLDCACGTGEITLRLCQAGYQLTGLDASLDMLQIAQEKSRLAGLRIPFIQQDMRRIALHRPVDAIVCACDGVNYLTAMGDVRAFFRAAHAALKPSGVLLFDISSRYKLSHILGDHLFGEDQEDCAYLWQNIYDPQNHLCEMQLTFFQRQGTLYERFCERHVQRAHSARELITALESSGFGQVQVYEAFTQSSPGPQAERLQFTARPATILEQDA